MSTAAPSKRSPAPQQPDSNQRQDPRVVALAEKIYIDIMRSASGPTKSPQYNVALSLARAAFFYQQVDQDPWTATAEERMAALAL